MLKELVEIIKPQEGLIYVDLTLGAGGHSKSILEKIKRGKLVCFDLSFGSIDSFYKWLIKNQFKVIEEKDLLIRLNKGEIEVILVNVNFIKLTEVLNNLEIKNVDGIIADLGWSSDELTEIEGLSYEHDVNAYLDMRFDKNMSVTAADLLNGLGKSELSKMFEKYADVYGKFNQSLVSEVISFRKKGPISKVRDLKLIIDRAFKFKLGDRFNKNEVYKTYSRVFQALRISVNAELQNLEMVINESFELLNKKGAMGVITFHSGEDKVVVPFLQSKLADNALEVTSQSGEELCIRPSLEEVKENVRARSAKLYSFIKL